MVDEQLLVSNCIIFMEIKNKETKTFQEVKRVVT